METLKAQLHPDFFNRANEVIIFHQLKKRPADRHIEVELIE